MTTPHITRLAEAVTITPHTDIEVVRLVEAVKADGAQIIRTVQELEALDPDTIIVEQGGSMTAFAAMRIGGPGWFLPAVVVATGEQVRAARTALEES